MDKRGIDRLNSLMTSVAIYKVLNPIDALHPTAILHAVNIILNHNPRYLEHICLGI